MPIKRYKPEQIVTMLRQIEVSIANGKTPPQACKEAEITMQTFYRWRKEYGGLKMDQAKRPLWSMLAKSAMHQWSIPVSCHPHGRTGPATRTRVSQHASVREGTARKKEGGSAVRRTQESDRTASSAPAGIKVCSRAILHGRGCAKHQTIGPVP